MKIGSSKLERAPSDLILNVSNVSLSATTSSHGLPSVEYQTVVDGPFTIKVTFFDWALPLRSRNVVMTLFRALVELAEYPKETAISEFNPSGSGPVVMKFVAVPTAKRVDHGWTVEAIVRVISEVLNVMIQFHMMELDVTVDTQGVLIGGGSVRSRSPSGNILADDRNT